MSSPVPFGEKIENAYEFLGQPEKTPASSDLTWTRLLPAGVEDWDEKSPGLSFLRLENRTNTAARPVLPSSSKSLTFLRYDLMNYGVALEEPPQTTYNLSDFLESSALGGATAQPMTVHENVAHWIEKEIIKKLPDRDHRTKLKVFSERALHLPNPTAPSLETSLMKRPDVGLYYRFEGQQYVILQIEVDSGGYQKTCIKLADGIAQQLVLQRNRDDKITSCTALYFPTFERGTSVVKLTLTWDDRTFHFHLKHTIVPLEELKGTITRLTTDGISRITSLAVCHGTRHIVPMSKSFVTNAFGEGAMQVESGESVVIVNRQLQKVYKRPLHSVSRYKLASLMSLDRSLFTRSLPPIAQDQDYFEFPLLKPPIKRETARSDIFTFVSSVVFALNELHNGLGLAHLDIRLDNVCFDSGNRAILIDLDRCRKVNYDVVAEVATESLMYPYHSDWVYGQWDYVQLGLMIARIIYPVSGTEYHTVEPPWSHPPLNHDFLKKLYREGVMEEDLFDSWKMQLGSSISN